MICLSNEMTTVPQCKAGLGRTGTLIGAYMVWKYGFTANEAIAFMRIVRPGSVVGPQQQYLYLKQLEWCKWAAVDEMKKQQQQATEALASATLVTPATPPADDEELPVMDVTPPNSTGPANAPVPPVTPSRHIATAAAKAKAIATPGQPRKTPVAKRVFTQDSDDEEADVLPALGIAPVTRNRVKPTRGVTSSESRPTRVTRSTASAAAIRKTGAAVTSTKASSSTPNQGPNKIPRLATTRTTSAAKAAVASAHLPKPVPLARRANAPSPTPSRLPTLVPSRKISSLTEVAVAAATVKKGTPASNAWMTAGAKTIIVPASKADTRPGVRPVRRRRSSFSSADVIA